MKCRSTFVKRCSVALFSVILLLVASAGFAYNYLGEVESYDVISGDPLEIVVGESGTLGVLLNETEQYYDGDCWGSVLFVESGDPGSQQKFISTYFSDWHEDPSPVFTPVSIDKVSDYEINAVFDAGESSLRVSQNIIYVNGERYYKKTWSISNIGETNYSDLRFFHGGDTTFGGIDSSLGHYNDILNMIYLTNPDAGIDGIMGFYAHPSSPAVHYQEGNYGEVVDNMLVGLLDDSVDSSDHDAGYSLQWNRDTLAPGETWEIVAFEKWTEAGFVQVLAPADQKDSANVTIDYDFSVLNIQASPDIFDLNAVSSSGWTATVDPSVVSVDAFSSESVIVSLVVPADAVAGATDTLTLSATSRSDDTVTNSDSVATTVSGAPPAKKDTSGGSGCNTAALVPSALLLIAPLFLLARRR